MTDTSTTLTLNDLQAKLQQLQAEAEAALTQVASLESLDEVRVKYLGRKGELTAVMRFVKDLPPADRPAARSGG